MPSFMRRLANAILVLALVVGFASFASAAGGGGDGGGGGGGGGCQSDGSCSAPSPSCSSMSTFGVDNCGDSCEVVYWEGYENCSAPTPSCSQLHTTGTTTCGFPCDDDFTNSCQAPSPACGQTTSGTRICGQACTKTGPPCNTWEPYGYAVPGHPTYSFGLGDNNTKDLLALAAKGNMILGDYTSDKFVERAIPMFDGGVESATQPYAVDPTDEDLGYVKSWSGGLPMFDGDYDEWDGGYKLGMEEGPGAQRKFYESSLDDDMFRSLLDESWMPDEDPEYGVVSAVLFTNHLLAGYAPHDDTFYFFGSMVARDDAFMFEDGFESMHDARLSGMGGGLVTAGNVGLPMSVGRPVLQSWRECSSDPLVPCL